METIKKIAQDLERSTSSRIKNIANLPSSRSSKCAACADSGYVMENGLAHECSCLVERRVQFRIPLRYRAASLLDFSEAIQKLVSDWITHPTDGLLITGNVGCGKTHLAAAMTRSLILVRQANVRFERCSEFYARLRESYRAGTPEESAWGNLASVLCLFLDDLGAGSLSDHERRATLDLLDRRMNAVLPTCVTSNWGLAQIAEKMDERIASRLQSFTLLRLDGEDHRATEGRDA